MPDHPQEASRIVERMEITLLTSAVDSADRHPPNTHALTHSLDYHLDLQLKTGCFQVKHFQ